MRLFHELVWEGYVSGSAAVYSKHGLEALLGSADQLSFAGYAAGITGTSPTLSVQVEQSFDGIRWSNRNLNPELNSLALSTSAETNFAGWDGNPSARPTAAFARLRIALGGTSPAGHVRIWATGRDPEGETTPVTILGAASVLQWCRADRGITTAGVTIYGNPAVSNWADESGNGNDYVQGTASQRPDYGPHSTPNSQAAIFFDGVSQQIVASALSLPAPGTTPTYAWLVVSQSTWTLNHSIFGADGPSDGNSYVALYQSPTTPTLRQACGSAQDNGGLALSTWGRVECAYTNSTSDFIKCRSTSVTGTNSGNNSGSTGRRLGKTNNTGTGFGNFGIAEIVYVSRIPTAAERAALDAYCTDRYGTGLV